MKKLLLPLLIVLPLASFAAKDAPNEHTPRHAPLERVLNLTEAQSKELQTIRQQQFEELRAVNERTDQRVLEILDADQRATFTTLKEQQQKRFAERGERGEKPERPHKSRKNGPAVEPAARS